MTNDIQFIERVLRAFAFDYCDQLFFRDDDGELTFYAECNDVFFWGSADVEPITVKTIDELEKARQDIADAEEAAGDSSRSAKYPSYLWVYLYCARRRQQRPQGVIYKGIDEHFRPLFDECGPHREAAFGNPVATP